MFNNLLKKLGFVAVIAIVAIIGVLVVQDRIGQTTDNLERGLDAAAVLALESEIDARKRGAKRWVEIYGGEPSPLKTYEYDAEIIEAETTPLTNDDKFDAIADVHFDVLFVETNQSENIVLTFRREKTSKEWQRYYDHEKPVDPELVRYVEQTQDLVQSARKMKTLIELGPNFPEFKQALLELATARQGIPSSIPTDGQLIIKQLDRSLESYQKALDAWGNLINSRFDIGNVNKQALHEYIDLATTELNGALDSYTLIESRAKR